MEEKMVYNLYKDMEDRYLKWMNYYSLFNGALLVAYYSIYQLISNDIKEGIFLNNHWKFLALIAIMGCIASYCWYLSAIGHYHWIKRWREAHIKEPDYPKLDFSEVNIHPCCNKAMHYHSTFKVTIGFIICVLFAWTVVAYCSMFNPEFSISGVNLLIPFLFVLGLIFIEFFIHVITGSDLSHYNKPLDKKGIACILYEGISKNLGWTIAILLFVLIIIYAVCNCSNIHISVKDISQSEEKSEIVFKIEVLNSDSLILNESVKTTIKH